MNPRVWGPPAWQFLHAIPKGYPTHPDAQTRDSYRLFYQTLGEVLPCPGCRAHYRTLWATQPITDADLASPEALAAWTDRLHRQINQDRDATQPPPIDSGSDLWSRLFLALVVAVAILGILFIGFQVAVQRRHRVLAHG